MMIWLIDIRTKRYTSVVPKIRANVDNTNEIAAGIHFI